MSRKLLLLIIDGVPWRNWRRLFGNLEGWVASGEARVWRHRAVLPSVSAPCYASIHTGVPPQVHGVWGNDHVFRLSQPDIFSELTRAGRTTGAVAHSFWSEFFHRAPFLPVRDLEYDEPGAPITHGRFHTMAGYNGANQMTPSDHDLFWTLGMLTDRFGIDYGMLHTCTLDSMGHRFHHDCHEMDAACELLDAQLAPHIARWRTAGYEVMVTADHGQDARGHHGGTTEEQTDAALYWFGGGEGPAYDTIIGQLQLAPTILTRLGVPVLATMQATPFLR
jgi:predicted AlkP superfamily pyrophosphatase or phosphodiesterase